MTTPKVITVSCPTCKSQVVWSSNNPNKPFCSERCKMIDLGDWATEAHKIAGESLIEGDESEAFVID